MSLDSFIATVRALPQAADPRKALDDCRKQMLDKIEGAKTLAEKEAAYLYYKAFYEHLPWSLIGEINGPNTGGNFDYSERADNLKNAGSSLLRGTDTVRWPLVVEKHPKK